MRRVVENHRDEELLVVIAKGLAIQGLVAVFGRLLLQTIPGGHLARGVVIGPVGIVGLRGLKRVNEILERDDWSLLRDAFGVRIRTTLTVELPRQHVILIPRVHFLLGGLFVEGRSGRVLRRFAGGLEAETRVVCVRLGVWELPFACLLYTSPSPRD